MDLFLEVLLKFQKIFKSTIEQMRLIYIVHTAIRKESLHREAHMLFSILCCPTNELKDYSNKPVKQKSVEAVTRGVL